MIFNHENNIICFISWMIQKENAVYNKIRYLNWRNRPLIYRQKLKLKELILRVINLFIEITKYSSDSEVKNIEQIWKHISFVSYVWTYIIHMHLLCREDSIYCIKFKIKICCKECCSFSYIWELILYSHVENTWMTTSFYLKGRFGP
jgi:hypothetical protein